MILLREVSVLPSYRPQMKLRKSNGFTSVCQEFCPQGGVQVHAQRVSAQGVGGPHPCLGGVQAHAKGVSAKGGVQANAWRMSAGGMSRARPKGVQDQI